MQEHAERRYDYVLTYLPLKSLYRSQQNLAISIVRGLFYIISEDLKS